MEAALVAIIVVHVFGWALAVADDIGHGLGVLRDDEEWFVKRR